MPILLLLRRPVLLIRLVLLPLRLLVLLPRLVLLLLRLLVLLRPPRPAPPPQVQVLHLEGVIGACEYLREEGRGQRACEHHQVVGQAAGLLHEVVGQAVGLLHEAWCASAGGRGGAEEHSKAHEHASACKWWDRGGHVST